MNGKRKRRLAGALGLIMAGVAVAAGTGGGHPTPRTYRDRIVDPAGPAHSAGVEGAAGTHAKGASASAFEAAAAPSSAGPAQGGPGSTGTGPPAPARSGGLPAMAAPARPRPTRPPPPGSGAGATAVPGWRTISGAPIGGRFGHAAAWTGREMVVWGGRSDWESPPGNDGAAYDPVAATWRHIRPAPLSGRSQALAFWTGREVLVWGGMSDEGDPLADGAAWDPATDHWRRIADSPVGARDGAAVVWAGDTSTPAPAPLGDTPSPGRLVVWGGVDWQRGQERNDGAAYDPAADRWTPLTSAPLSPRGWAQAGWTGDRVVISGGTRSDGGRPLADGAAWDPATDRWTPVASRPVGGACPPEEACVVVWTGTRMLLSDSRLVYDPASDGWHRRSGSPAEEERWLDESTVWTGSRMITWGGHPNQVDDQGVAVPGGLSGVVYDPGADRWSELEKGPLTPRTGHSAVWTGQDMLVWGGSTADVALADGAAYRPPGQG